ncbi:hypothetical protein ACWTU6_10005 [Mesorhizobium sp. BHbsci]
MTWLETNLQQSADSSGMIWIQATRRVDRTKTAGTNEDEHAIERDLLALQDKHSRSDDWRRRHFAGSPTTKLAGMTSSEVSTLHAALFFATGLDRVQSAHQPAQGPLAGRFWAEEDARPLRQLAAERTEGPRRDGGLRWRRGRFGGFPEDMIPNRKTASRQVVLVFGKRLCPKTGHTQQI